jgi:hypothetical protein
LHLAGFAALSAAHLCSTGITRLPRSYGPLRHPMRPGLTLTRCQLVTTATTTRVSRVAAGPLCLHAVTLTPGGLMEPIRSYYSISFGLPQLHGGSAPALIVSRPAQRSLTLRPACSPSRLSEPLHRRLRRPRFLLRRSDCYRVERTSSGGDFHPQ